MGLLCNDRERLELPRNDGSLGVNRFDEIGLIGTGKDVASYIGRLATA